MQTTNEILCTACGKQSLVRREPVYDGFRKTGDICICVSCGHRYAPGETPPSAPKSGRPVVFTDADRETKPDIFKHDERGHCCTHCVHFTVNPFTQRCGLTDKIVRATDVCDAFEKAAGE